MARMIGVVGGMGTYASIDLLKKIADNTPAGKDQEHLPVTMISKPEEILDRTQYLFGEVMENPGYAISDIVKSLGEAGCELIGLPCNTAHVPEIIGIIEDKLPEGMQIVNMIEEVGKYISNNYPGLKKVGILATNGTYSAKVYDHYLKHYDLSTVYPDKDVQFKKVHPSIYDPVYGIKARSNPVSEKAVADLLMVSMQLVEKGAEVLVLGCTEIPLAITEKSVYGINIIDPNDVLAKALVLRSA